MDSNYYNIFLLQLFVMLKKPRELFRQSGHHKIWPQVATSCGDHIQIGKVPTLIFGKNQRGNCQVGTKFLTEIGECQIVSLRPFSSQI